MNFQKIFERNDKLYIGLARLATDVQTVANLLQFKLNLYQLKENKKIQPKTFMNMVASMLYQHRFDPYFVVNLLYVW